MMYSGVIAVNSVEAGCLNASTPQSTQLCGVKRSLLDFFLPGREVEVELADAIDYEQDAFVVWDEAVGERIAKIATPTRMLRGTLIVSVKSGAWRNELSMRKQEIVGRINELLGGEIVKDIKFQ